MAKLHISSTPHIHEKGSSTRNIMLDVVIAMLPATVAGIIIFGLQALWITLTCVATAVLSEYLFNLAVGKKQTVGDLSAVVTGLLLALNLSINVPIWQCVIGSVFNAALKPSPGSAVRGILMHPFSGRNSLA